MKNKSALKWLYKNSKHITLYMTVLVIIGVAASYIGVNFALLSKNVLDIALGDTQGSLLQAGLNLVIMLGVYMVLSVSYSLIEVRVSGKLKIGFKKNLFSALLKKDWQKVSAYHTGELSNRMHNDINIITTGIMSILPNVVSLVTRIVFSFFTLYFLDRTFALICLCAGPVIFVSARIYSKYIKILHKKCQESDGKVRSFMQECLQNLLVIKSFRNEEKMTDRSTVLQDKNYKLLLKRNDLSVVANLLFFVAMNAGAYLALLYCAVKVSKGLMAVGTLTAIFQLVNQIQGPFRNLSGFVPQYYSMLASAERIMELENLPDEVETVGNEFKDTDIYSKLKAIRFDKMSFTYTSDVVFEKSDASIEKGEFIAISGRSGIGKSTLIRLILGIINPTEGDIYVELTDGRKVKMGKSTRDLFAYVPQGNMILSGTIRENIAFAVDNIDDEKVKNAAQVAEIWDFISTLPKGMDTELGENGLGLSEGQTQRVAIARAIYHDAPIILLDEATSALDEATETAVIENIKKLNTKTCIFISHRPAVFNICSGELKIEDKVITRQ